MTLSKARRWCGSILTLVVLSAASAQAAIDWKRGTIQPPGAPFYKTASAAGTPLGEYPSGATVTLYPNPANGFYAVYVPKGQPNAGYVYVAQSQVSVGASLKPATSTQSSGGGGGSSSRADGNAWRARLGLAVFDLSPSDMQVALGASAASLFSVGFSLGIEYRVATDLSLLFNAERYSTSQTIAQPVYQGVATASPTNYSLTAFNFLLGAHYNLYRGTALSLAFGAAVGMGMNTFSTVNGFQTGATLNGASTTGIPFQFFFVADYLVSSSFGLFLNLGYQMEKLSNVPYAPNTFSANGSVATFYTQDLNLSAPFARLGLSYAF